MTLFIAIITLFSVLLAIGLLVRHSRDMKGLENLHKQLSIARGQWDLMSEKYIDERHKTTRLLNQITRQNNELRHNREEISTLKADINTLLLKNKLHSCKPDTIFQED